MDSHRWKIDGDPWDLNPGMNVVHDFCFIIIFEAALKGLKIEDDN